MTKSLRNKGGVGKSLAAAKTSALPDESIRQTRCLSATNSESFQQASPFGSSSPLAKVLALPSTISTTAPSPFLSKPPIVETNTRPSALTATDSGFFSPSANCFGFGVSASATPPSISQPASANRAHRGACMSLNRTRTLALANIEPPWSKIMIVLGYFFRPARWPIVTAGKAVVSGLVLMGGRPVLAAFPGWRRYIDGDHARGLPSSAGGEPTARFGSAEKT